MAKFTTSAAKVLSVAAIMLQSMLLPCPAAAQQAAPSVEPPLRFKALNTAHGASSDWVFHIAEDSLGFLWFAGFSGLTRYDGRGFGNYFHKPDDITSLAGNRVHHILPRSDGSIICSTIGDGFSIFDPNSQTFKNFGRRSSPRGPEPFPATGMHLTDSTFIFLGGRPRSIWLCDFSVTNPAFEEFPLEIPGAVPPFRENKSKILFRDPRDDRTFFILGNFRIYRFNTDERILTTVRDFSDLPNKTNGFEHLFAAAIYDEDHLILNVSQRGFFKVNLRDGNAYFICHDPSNPSEYTNTIGPAVNGSYYAGSTDGRLFRLFPEKGEIREVEIVGDGTEGAHITCIYRTSRGEICLGTNGRGVLKHDPREERFQQIIFGTESVPKPYNFNRGIIHGKRPLYYVNSVRNPHEILRIHLKTGAKEAIRSPENTVLYRGNFIRDTEGNPITHDGVDLYLLPEKGGVAVPLGLPRENDTLPGKILFIATDGNGTYALCGRNFLALSEPDCRMKVHEIGTLPFDFRQWQDVKFSPGQVTLAAQEGFVIFDRNTEEMHIPSFTDALRTREVKAVRYMHTDGEDILAPSALQGIYRMAVNKDSIVVKGQYTAPVYIVSNNQFAASTGPDGMLWTACDRGFLRFNPHSERSLLFSRGQNLKNIYRDNPLSFNEDRLFATHGNNDLVWGNLDPLLYTERDTELIIHTFNLNGRIVPLKLKGDTTEVRLNHDENIFDISWSHLNASSPDFYITEYKTHGLDHDWLACDRDYTARYTGLQPGDYRFEVRVRGITDGEVVASGSLNIFISPPFHQTPLFRISLLILIAALIYAIMRIRLNMVRKEQAIITAYNKQLAESEMQFLQARMNPHFLFNSLNSIKHFILLNEKQKATEYLGRFSELIRSVLRFSAEQHITLREETETLATYLELEKARFSGSFSFAIDISPDVNPDELRIRPLIFQPYAENAVWHGLMHKPGSRKLHIRIGRKGRYLQCEIEDNGIGRKASAAMRSSRSTRKSLGLEVTERRLKAADADAEVKIEDVLNAAGEVSGTCVYLRIPIITKPKQP